VVVSDRARRRVEKRSRRPVEDAEREQQREGGERPLRALREGAPVGYGRAWATRRVEDSAPW
jgi:hypothetical protein